MASKDNLKSLRKDNDQLKKQLQELAKDFENVKSKMAEQRRNQASPVAQPNEKAIKFLSDQYNDLLKSETSLEEEIGKLRSTESTKPSTTFSAIVIPTNLPLLEFHKSRETNLLMKPPNFV